ncbi:hypothetical protein cypCar_00014168 [Cyprinus carpio]|nr:hypothetical protein cypCar_00014168 [Cyprinus carpio]
MSRRSMGVGKIVHLNLLTEEKLASFYDVFPVKAHILVWPLGHSCVEKNLLYPLIANDKGREYSIDGFILGHMYSVTGLFLGSDAA